MQQKEQILLSSDFSYPLVIAKNKAKNGNFEVPEEKLLREKRATQNKY